MIRPLRDYVVVQLEPEHVTGAGIILRAASQAGIRESQTQYGHRGVVLAVGPGAKDRKGRLRETAVKAGDIVRFGEFELKQLDEPDQVMIQEADITGIEEYAEHS